MWSLYLFTKNLQFIMSIGVILCRVGEQMADFSVKCDVKCGFCIKLNGPVHYLFLSKSICKYVKCWILFLHVMLCLEQKAGKQPNHATFHTLFSTSRTSMRLRPTCSSSRQRSS